MVRNNGKSLEELVSELERVAVRSGKRVDINKKVFDDKGVQISEFDIIVSSGEGNQKIKWLIECRDRPSKGAAPGSWIEQIYGRKNLNGFDRAIAVSTTGFSQAAIHWAKKGNIELRTAEELLQPEMWLCNTIITYSKTGTFSGMRVMPADESDAMQKYLNDNLPKNADDLLLYFESCLDPVKPRDVFQSACLDEKNGLYNELKPNESKAINISYRSVDGNLRNVKLIVNEKDIPLYGIILSGIIRIDVYEDQFTSIDALKSTNDRSLIGQRIVTSTSCEAAGTITLYETVNADGSRQLAVKATRKA